MSFTMVTSLFLYSALLCQSFLKSFRSINYRFPMVPSLVWIEIVRSKYFRMQVWFPSQFSVIWFGNWFLLLLSCNILHLQGQLSTSKHYSKSSVPIRSKWGLLLRFFISYIITILYVIYDLVRMISGQMNLIDTLQYFVITLVPTDRYEKILFNNSREAFDVDPSEIYSVYGLPLEPLPINVRWLWDVRDTKLNGCVPKQFLTI